MHRNLGWLFGLGAVLVALGIAGLYFKLTFTKIYMRYLGGIVVIAGGIQCFDAYRAERWLTRFWRSLAVVAYLAGGLTMFVFPDQSSSLVIMPVGAVLIIVGSFRVVFAVQLRYKMKLWRYKRHLVKLNLRSTPSCRAEGRPTEFIRPRAVFTTSPAE